VTGVAPATSDARASNWRYVVPCSPAPLVVGPDGVPLAQVLAGVALDGVVVPDLAARDPAHGTGPRPAGGSRAVLAALCAQTAPGGWLCVAFGNRWNAARPCRPGSLGLGAARRVIRRCGLSVVDTYVALPDHRHPAMLVPGERAAELDHVLRCMLVTYVPGDAPFPRLARHALGAMRSVAMRTPHPVRLRVLPGYLVLARRPR
jgi:hypothetical protein